MKYSCEIIRDLLAVCYFGKFTVALRIASSARDTAEQEQFIIKLQITVNQPHIRQIKNCFINTDIAFSIVMRLGSFSLHNYLCCMVYLRKRQDTAGMVVVSVAENDCINCG